MKYKIYCNLNKSRVFDMLKAKKYSYADTSVITEIDKSDSHVGSNYVKIREKAAYVQRVRENPTYSDN